MRSMRNETINKHDGLKYTQIYTTLDRIQNMDKSAHS